MKHLTALSGQDFKSGCVFGPRGCPPEGLTGLSSRVHNDVLSLEHLDRLIQGVGAPPTDRVKAAVGDVRLQATSLIERWKNILAQDVPALNNELQTASLPPINIAP